MSKTVMSFAQKEGNDNGVIRIPNMFDNREVGHWEWTSETGAFSIEPEFLEQHGFKPCEFEHLKYAPKRFRLTEAETVTPENNGHSRCVLRTKKFREMLHPLDVDDAIQNFFDMVCGDKHTMQQRFRARFSPDRPWSWFHVNGQIARRSPTGFVAQMSGMIYEINDVVNIEKAIRKRDMILEASVLAASIMLGSRMDDFDQAILEILSILGTASIVDRVFLWKYARCPFSDKLSVTRSFEWSPETGAHINAPWFINIPFHEKDTDEGVMLASGQCIRNSIREMPCAEKNYLKSHGIQTVLIAPILGRDELWGGIALGSIQSERQWSDLEEGLLKSTGLHISGAIQCGETRSTPVETERTMIDRLFEAKSYAVAIIQDDTVVKRNPLFSKMFHTDVNGKIDPFYHSTKLRKEIGAALKQHGCLFNKHIRCYCDDGVFRDFLANYQSIDYEGKSAIIHWAYDATEMVKTEKEMAGLKKMAELGIRAKHEFITRIGHEFKTPLNAILGMTHLCLQTETTDKQKEYLQRTRKASEFLREIVDKILDFSEIENGSLELDEYPFQLSSVIEEVFDVIEYEAECKGISLSAQIDGAAYAYLLGDAGRLRQILLNIVDNAIKFTDRGEIRLWVEAIGEQVTNGQGYQEFQFVVSDTGIGIETDLLQSISEAFYLVDGSSTRKYGGIGLGLTISKKLIELMGGTLELESYPEQGTTARFSIRFLRDELKTCTCMQIIPARSAISPKRSRIEGAHILLVEDNRINQLVVTELLRQHKVDLRVVCNGLEAVEAIKDGHFELVLMDIQMPVMDGLEATREIRKLSNGDYTSLPILAMTSNNLEIDQQRSFEVGMNDHLTKPIDPLVLNQALERWILAR